VGAGPQGLSVAAHCRDADIDFRIFGRTMVAWIESMPDGMRLKSSPAASNITDPAHAYTLERYSQITARTVPEPVPVSEFVKYGQWIRAQVAPAEDPRLVRRISRDSSFCIELTDDEILRADKVVLALGIDRFAVTPPEFSHVPDSLAAHSSRVSALAGLSAKRVLVLGAGQSAQETAALLHEAGAEVELVTRRSVLPRLSRQSGLEPHLRRLVPHPVISRIYLPTDLGRQPYHLAIAYPELFRKLPRRWKERISWSVMKPSGAVWLDARLRDVRVTRNCFVRQVRPDRGGLEIELSDGTQRHVDFAVLATGFRADVQKYTILDQALKESLSQVGGYPCLGLDFQTNIPGLYMVGAIAAWDHGPITRFVCGSLVYERLLMPSLQA
jgi:thioredoxin reductase